ncbi:MAG: TIGR03009 domain-containing protein [Gemmataceae bacterium]
MRIPVFVLTGLLTTGAMAGAQSTPAGKGAPANTPPAASAAPTKLDGYLLRWEQEMKKVNTLSAAVARHDKDKSFGSATKYSGAAHYMKAGSGATTLNLAMLELKQEGKSEIADKYICTGTYLYQFFPPQKEIRAYEMPKPKPGQVADDGFLGLMFGMKADEAKRRFSLTLSREDSHYIYVDIQPRHPADKSDFTRAQLVLNKDSFLPRRLWFEHPNGNEVTWDIPAIKTGVELNRRAFDAPAVPAGWKLVPVSRGSANAPAAATPAGANPPPRIIRQAGKEG